jgi:outer membrane protein
MKKIIVMCVFLTMTVGLLFSAELKFALVDTERVYNASKEKQTAQNILEKEANDLNKQLEKKYNEVMSFEQSFREQAAFLSQEEGKKKQQELMTKQEEFNKLRGELNQKLARREAELMKPIFDKIRSIVTNLRKERGLDVIFDKSVTLSANDDLDMTDIVIERVNK